MPERNRKSYLTVLRVLCMMSVVFLHSAAIPLRTYYHTRLWHFFNLGTAICGAAVPLFFMLSGAGILNSSSACDVNYLFRRRLPKVFIPFLFWSVLCALYYPLSAGFFTGDFHWPEFWDALLHLQTKPAMVHLWFLYALIPLYLLSPFVKELCIHMGEKLLHYALMLWLILAIVFPTLERFTGSISPVFAIMGGLNPNVVSGYAGYFLLGWYLDQKEPPILTRTLLFFAAADTALITTGTYFLTNMRSAYAEDFKSYLGFFTALLAACIFLLMKRLFKKNPPLPSLIEAIGALSFCVYLCHNLFIIFFSKLLPVFISRASVSALLTFPAVLFSSLFAAFVLTSTPLSFLAAGLPFCRACKQCNLIAFCKTIFHFQKN